MEETNELGDWKKIATLGAGSFGIVTLWRHGSTNEYVAIKKCRREAVSITPKERTRWIQEVDFMKNLKHPNIIAYKTLPDEFVKALERYNLSKLPLLPMEYCNGGNLRMLLKQPQNACGLREIVIRRILKDISSGIAHLHRQQISHRDIKPENIVIHGGSNESKVYKLIDLGYAKDMNLLVSYVGTLNYTAPEIFRNEEYNHTVDYWSFGIVAYEICCGKNPFLPQLGPFERFELIGKKGPRDICLYKSQEDKLIYTDKILEPNHISRCFQTHLEDWLGSMLEYKPTERGIIKNGDSVFDALNHILQKRLVHVFCVYNYTSYCYELEYLPTLHDLQLFIQRDAGLNIDEQYIIITTIKNTSKGMSQDVYLNFRSDVTFTSQVSSTEQPVLYVFKRSNFIQLDDTITLPISVRNLLNCQHGEIRWNFLHVQTNEAVHFIEKELEKMGNLLQGVSKFDEYLQKSFAVQNKELFMNLQASTERLLLLVEVCKELNSVNVYDSSKHEIVKKYRKCLWRIREMVENINAASVRWRKLKTHLKLLQQSYEMFIKWYQEFYDKSILQGAIDCLNITKQKAVISAGNITVVICKCLKMRNKIQNDDIIIEHVRLCFKVLSEYNKLLRWTKALELEHQTAYNDLLNIQKELTKTNQQENNLRVVSGSNSNSNYTESVDDLIECNRSLRYRIDDAFNSLLNSYKLHATSVEEFVQYVNDLSNNGDISGAS